MSARPEGTRPTAPDRRRRASLRARLLVAFVVPLVAVLALVGIASVAAVRHELVSQVDTRLEDVAFRSANYQHQPGAGGQPAGTAPDDAAADAARNDGHGDGDGDGDKGHGDGHGDDDGHDHGSSGKPDFLYARGQGEGTLGARIVDGVCTEAAVLGARFQVASLDAKQGADLTAVPADGHPRTVDLGGELGEYRVVSNTTDGGEVLVNGLPLASTSAAVTNLVGVELLVGLLSLVAAGLVAALVIRRTLRPLARVASTATRVSELPLSSGEVRLVERVPPQDTDSRTEVGQVGTALNRLLDHVEGSLAARQTSETQVRQFVADASHELRTPLSSIRGYTELVRRQGGELPDHVGHAVGRVESEALRMSALVEELLLLARLDAGRELSSEEVDLTALVVDAVSDAHVAGPDHHWQLDLPDTPVLVPGDPDRLHQALVNLLANARAHTPAGTTVTTRLSTVDGWAQLEVVDDGPGIPPDLLGHVFERFARGDSSRSRTAGGTGLGLAIVHAVVTAHGGTVTVASQPGRTVFAERLPHATRPPAGD